MLESDNILSTDKPIISHWKNFSRCMTISIENQMLFTFPVPYLSLVDGLTWDVPEREESRVPCSDN